MALWHVNALQAGIPVRAPHHRGGRHEPDAEPQNYRLHILSSHG